MSNAEANQVKRMIAQRFTSSSMSNSKWRKLFFLLAAPNLGLSKCGWKFVNSDHVYYTGIPAAGDLSEGRLTDGSFQPFAYEEIEWIEVKTSDPSDVINALACAGQFDCQTTAAGVRIYGYC